MRRLGGKKLLLGMLLAGVPFFLAAQSGEEANAAAEAAGAAAAAEASNRSIQRVLEAGETSAERHRQEITEEAGSRLFNMDIFNTDVSLFISGFWKGSLSFNWGIANTLLGTAPNSENAPVLFTQETDLTLSLWIWQKWFLEASFVDGYDVNTYRAGYQGLPGETVQYVGAGNTGLDFPVFPYLDLGGDSSSSFGIYGRFGSDDLAFHTLFRYDAAVREERIFVGNRERNFSNLIPNKPLRGRSFVLPDENIASVPVVYFEDKEGDLFDGPRRWRLAKPSEYAASARYGTVELSLEPQGMVAVSYGGGIYSMGSYSSATTPPFIPGAGFLGNVQEHFGSGIDLKSHPQPGGNSNAPAVISIGGVSALVIYQPGTFSPFERQSRYQAPSNNTEEAALVRLSSGERDTRYELLPVDTLSTDFILYGDAVDNAAGYSSAVYSEERKIFEMIRSGSVGSGAAGGGRNRRDPITMWPLDEYPEIYLPGSPAFTGDIRIRFTDYGPAGAYTIGTDAIPGSVQVYRGGIIDTRIQYEAESGIVTLESPVGFNETIRITYLKRSEERRLGSIAAGVGLVYKPEESPFSAEIALGMRWNVSQETYTEEGASSPGTVGFGAKTSWDYKRLSASLSLGLGFEQPDTTGLYRIAGMEGRSEIVLGVSTTAGFISKVPVQADPVFPNGGPLITVPLPFASIGEIINGSNRKELIYRNYRRSDWLGGTEMMSIDWSASVVSGLEGPYPARDGAVDVFVAEFENLAPNEWTGFQIPLGSDGQLLEQAKGIIIPIRFLHPNANSNILVAAQFGVLADEDSGNIENPGLMVEFPLFYGAPSSSWIEQNDIPGGKYVAISLNDEMRRKLRNAGQMRILIMNLGNTPLDNRLLVAKPFIMGASWRAITLEGAPSDGRIQAAADTGANTDVYGSVSAAEVQDRTLNSKKIDRLHESAINHVLKVEWNGISAAGVDGRTSPLPLSDYNVLSFYLKGPLVEAPFSDTAYFHFFVSQGPDAYPGKTALKLTMKVKDLEIVRPLTDPSSPDDWYSVEIHYKDNKVLINGIERPCTISYNPVILQQGFESGDFAGDGQSCYIAALIENNTAVIPNGTFSIDEICLEDPAPSYRINGGATLDWKHPEALISIGETAVVSGVSFSTALESAALGDPFNDRSETFTGAQSRSQAEVNILDTILSGNVMFTASSDSSYWSAGHNISRSFGPLSVSESFNTAPPPNEETMNHSLTLALDTLLQGNIGSEMKYQNRQLNRLWVFSTGINPKQNGHPGFFLEGNLDYAEKTEKVAEWMPNYAQTWVESWTAMIPGDGSESGTQNRSARAMAGFSLDRRPVGAELSFEGKSEVSIPLVLTNSFSGANIAFPFRFNPVRGSLRLQREISRTLVYSGNNIQDDIFLYGQSLSDTGPLWQTIPVFSIFDSKLDSSMENTLQNYSKDSENTRFYELLGLSLSFPERYDIFSLFVPVAFSGQLSRTLEQRLDTRLDVLTISPGVTFSSINLFGAMGSKPVFGFYRNDELRHSVTGTVSLPRSEDPVWRIQAEQHLGVYGFKGAEMGIDNTYTVTSTGWLESLGLIWIIPRDKTLLSAIYDAGMKKFSGNDYFPALSKIAQSQYERFFRETLECVLDETGDYGIYSISAEHESVVRILGKLTLTGFVKLTLRNEIEKDLLGIFLNFGTTLSVSF